MAVSTTGAGAGSKQDRGQIQRLVVVVFWWLVTLLTLIVLDDLLFGPIFWLLATREGGTVAVAAILAIYIPVQVLIVVRATSPAPGVMTRLVLGKLELARRIGPVRENEQRIHHRIAGAGSAVLLSLVIGGILPCLLLWRKGYRVEFVRRLSVVTAAVYAVEYAFLHGVIPASI
jgi:hypothetical protein